MGITEYIVLFVAIVYFAGGYILGRCHSRKTTWVTEVDPDPIRIERSDEHVADVIPLRARASTKQAREELVANGPPLGALGWVADHSRNGYRGLSRRRM
jgi:hypothetical protein